MGLDPEEVRHVAALARLSVHEEDLPQVAQDLSRILEHVSLLSTVPAEPRAPKSSSLAPRRPDQPAQDAREDKASALVSRSSGAHRNENGAHLVAVPTVVKKNSP